MKSKQRLHPLVILVLLGKFLKIWIVPIILLIPGLNSVAKLIHFNVWWLVAILIVVVLLFTVLDYLTFSFEIGSASLTIHSGILIKKHTHIPYDRIQSIEHNQWFFFKPFHLEQLTIETASKSDSPEGVLALVPTAVAAQIDAKRTGTSQRATETSIVAADTPHYQINTRELNLYALTSMGVVPLLVALGWLSDKVNEIFPKSWSDALTQTVTGLSILAIIALGVAFVLIGILASYLIILQKYFHFQLSAESTQLTTNRGLFRSVNLSVPKNRIQAVTFKQNIIRQWLKLTTVATISASKREGNDSEAESMTMMPVIQNSDAFSHLTPFLNWLPSQTPILTRLAPQRKWLFIRNALILPVIVAIPLIWFWRPWGWLSLLLLPWAFFQGWYASANTGWSLKSNQLILQKGSWFNRTLVVIPGTNIQSLAVRQSIWMKKTAMAHLRVNLRKGNGNFEMTVRYLPKTVADDIYHWYTSVN